MNIIFYIVVGFIAEMIDGMLGMAYGVSCRTFLTIFKFVPSNMVSAIVHFSELPTSFLTMISHLKFRNFDKKIMIELSVSGVIGVLIGINISISYINFFELIIDIYLIVMGFIILSKFFNNKKIEVQYNNKNYFLLGFLGAFFDTTGGGGYGPIVTGSLIAHNNDFSKVIGTVNSSEFFITLISSIGFGIIFNNIYLYFETVLGLIIGGIIAAPIAAKFCMKNTSRKMYFIVGVVLILLNVYNLILFL